MVELRYAQGTSYHHNQKSRGSAQLVKNVDRLNSVESFHPHLPDGGLIRSLYFFKIEEVICAEVFITNQRNS